MHHSFLHALLRYSKLTKFHSVNSTYSTTSAELTNPLQLQLTRVFSGSVPQIGSAIISSITLKQGWHRAVFGITRCSPTLTFHLRHLEQEWISCRRQWNVQGAARCWFHAGIGVWVLGVISADLVGSWMKGTVYIYILISKQFYSYFYVISWKIRC